MTPKQIKHLEELINKTGKRAAAFAMMVNHALSIDNPLIVETGCARQENNFDGDGMSTIIFDKLVEYHGGDFYSVDINPDNLFPAPDDNFPNCKVFKLFKNNSYEFVSIVCLSVSDHLVIIPVLSILKLLLVPLPKIVLPEFINK